MLRSAVQAFHFADFRLDLIGGQLWCGPTEVPLRRKAWQALCLLVQRAGELVSNEDLLESLWPRTAVHPKVLTNLIGELRRALDDPPASPRFIRTVHRRGYSFIGAVRMDAAAATARAGALVMPSAATPLVGRDVELAVFGQRLDTARQGRRQVLLVRGEEGLGKTALIDAFTAPLAAGGLWLGRGQCVEQHTEREAFGPVLGLLAALAGGPQGALVQAQLRRCAPSWLVQLPWLLAAGEADALRQQLAAVGPGRMLRECCALLEALAQDQALVLVLEDLHWADLATVDLLAHLAQGMAPAQLLLVASYRGVDAHQQAHPVASLARRLASHAHVTELALPLLSTSQVQRWIERRFGDVALADRLALRVHQQSDGHPLFVSALLDHLVDQGRLVPGPQGWALVDGSTRVETDLPDRLRSLIEARLAGLGADDRQLLEAASAIGLQFPAQWLAAALDRPAADLEAACLGLVQRRRFLRALDPADGPDGSRGAVFAFVHHAYQQALYDGLLPAARQGLHRRIAQSLEQGWGDRLSEVAGPLAAAYERAAMPDDAARVLEVSAAVSARRFAFRDVAVAIEASLRQLDLLPEHVSRVPRQIRLQLTLGNLCFAGYGRRHADALAWYRAAEALSRRVDQPRLLLRAQLGICVSLVIGGQPRAAQSVGQALVQGALDRQPSLRAIAHTHAGLAELASGALALACQHFEQALCLPPDTEVPVLSDTHGLAGLHLGRTLGHLGQLVRAQDLVDRAVSHIRRGAVPVQLVETLRTAADHAQLMGRLDEARALFDEVLVLADEHALPHYSMLGRLGRWWTWPAVERPLPEVETLVQQAHAIGEHWGRVGFLLLLADTRAAHGDTDGALDVLDLALGSLDSCPLFGAEVYRMKGELLASGGVDRLAAAKACLQAGLDLARSQQARVLGLRCALALNALLQRQGETAQAQHLLHEVVAGFGADAVHPDLRHARQRLAGSGLVYG